MKIDARKLTAQQQEEKRRLALKLYKEGYSQAKVGELIGVHRDTVGKWFRKERSEGSGGLKTKRRGRPKGLFRRLNEEDERHIRQLICDKRPDQLKMAFALWTRQAVVELIKQELALEIPIRTVGEYLKRWGMTPQKPLKRAYEQNPKVVQEWLDERYPEIKEQAKQEGAEIYWGDETGLRSDSQHGRGYAPKGKTPVIALNAKRSSINMISAITNQGKVRFQIYEGTMDAKRLIRFMKGLIKDASRKAYLILDNLRVHHAKLVKAWLAEHEAEIEVFHLPAYSPELNPDEYLNCDLKAAVHSGAPARSAQQLKQKTIGHMRKLQKMPTRVASYFQHEKIQYAA
jgi:transposase